MDRRNGRIVVSESINSTRPTDRVSFALIFPDRSRLHARLSPHPSHNGFRLHTFNRRILPLPLVASDVRLSRFNSVLFSSFSSLLTFRSSFHPSLPSLLSHNETTLESIISTRNPPSLALPPSPTLTTSMRWRPDHLLTRSERRNSGLSNINIWDLGEFSSLTFQLSFHLFTLCFPPSHRKRLGRTRVPLLSPPPFCFLSARNR